jgi:hypothetical protein
MGVSARVHSAQALEDFRGRLAEFRLEVIEALAAANAGLQQMFDWLEQQQKHWRHEEQKRNEAVIRARRDLEERRHAQARDHRGCTEQEVAYRKARQRLQEAEDKGQRCRAWLRHLPQHQTEYDAPARMLAGMMESEVVRALALLRQKTDLLAEYTSLQASSDPGTPNPSATSSIESGSDAPASSAVLPSEPPTNVSPGQSVLSE